jgi:alpha-beta hydrolase superfamily lysophospholipase
MMADRVRTSDGTELVTRYRAASGGAVPWAVVLIVHGLGEHSGRWEHFGCWLSEAGLDVHAYDQRGFGQSGGRRAYVDRWSQLHEDLASRVDAIRSQAPGLPIALYGHSLGGVVALGAVIDGLTSVEMLVLSAPGLDVTIPTWKRAAVRVLDVAWPTREIPNGIDPAVLSRDEGIQARYRSDPLNHHFTTARFGRQGLAEQSRLRASLHRLATPTLVIHSAQDGLVATAASAAFEDHPWATRRLWPGLRHELHNEPEGPQVVADVVAWMRGQVG